MTPSPSPSHDLRCGQCHRFLGLLPFRVLYQGMVRRAPSTPDVLLYVTCKCGACSRYEVAPDVIDSRMDYQEAA